MKQRITGLLMSWEALLVVLLVLTIAFGAAHSPVFLSLRTISAIMGELSESSVMVLGMTLIIIAAEIDLSVASILGVSSVLTGQLYAHHCPLALAIVAAMVFGIAAGIINAYFIIERMLPSLVVTLGTMALYRGFASVLIGDGGVSNFPDWFTSFGVATIPGTIVPWPFAIFFVLAVGVWWLLQRSYVGRQIYALGLSAKASEFSGIPVARIKTILFALSGLLSAAAGVIYTARFSSSRASNGLGLELDVITMVLLGGVSIFGGRGRLTGVLLGMILVATVRKALALADVPNEVHDAVIGALLIFAVLGPNLAGMVKERWRASMRAKAA